MKKSWLLKLMLDKQNKYAIISDQIDQDLEVACRRIKEEGYHFVELHNVFGKSIEECHFAEVAKIKAILDTYDLEVVNIASTIFFLCPLYPHYRVSLFNPSFHAIYGDVRYHLTLLHNACRVAKALNCHQIRIFPFRFPDNEDIDVVGTRQDLEEIAKHLRAAVAIAKQYNITLLLENCPYSHCPKGIMTYHLVEMVNDEHLRLLWDPANSYRCEQHKVPSLYLDVTLEEEYDVIKDKIAHVHLKNYTYDESKSKPFIHKGLLEGDIEYESLIKKLCIDDVGYLSLEPEVEENATIESMRKLKAMVEQC